MIGIENLDPILEKVEINDVWGVGRQLTKFYQKNGIYNAKQLKNKSNTWIKKCSNVLSSRTAMELRGVPCIDLETTQTKRKSCVVSRSFGKRIESFQELKEAVANYCLNASEKIRSESLVAKAITVFVRTSPFQRDYGYYSNSKTVDFPIATNNSLETVKTAIAILESIFRNGCRYQKAGVMLTGLRDDDGRKNLFSSEKDEKIKKLIRSIDNTSKISDWSEGHMLLPDYNTVNNNDGTATINLGQNDFNLLNYDLFEDTYVDSGAIQGHGDDQYLYVSNDVSQNKISLLKVNFNLLLFIAAKVSPPPRIDFIKLNLLGYGGNLNHISLKKGFLTIDLKWVNVLKLCLP